MEKGLEHLFITSRSSHFFNKTDFEQYLFNPILRGLYDEKGLDAVDCRMIASPGIAFYRMSELFIYRGLFLPASV